ncbi:hypothetical protein [Mangrovimonas aestuarii]|uniref:hypothetical protein n=1 Tax=Mangrovimonas aestuarii TaxID=3018443 RepID=UPI00237915DB|nr:hypothetical protein [Mangrovimonas aestuarii]
MGRFIGIAFTFFTVFNMCAQHGWLKGEIHLKSGDTLSGFVKIPQISKDLVATPFNNPDRVKYRDTRKSKTKTFEDNQVNMVVVEDTEEGTASYEFIPLSRKRNALFRVIEKGSVTLYGRSVGASTSMGPTFFSPAGGSAVPNIPTHYYYSSFNEFYVIKEGESEAFPLMKHGTLRSFKKQAIKYFHDCPSVVEKLKNKMYKEEDVKEVVEEYNACI